MTAREQMYKLQKILKELEFTEAILKEHQYKETLKEVGSVRIDLRVLIKNLKSKAFDEEGL